MVVLGIISYQVFPAEMGGQKCVDGFYRTLAQKADVILAVSKDNQTDTLPGIPVHNFLYNHWKAPLNLMYLFRLIRLIRKNKVDVVILEHSYMGWLGLLLRWLTGTPYVIHSHNIEAFRFRDMHRFFWKWYHSYERYVHRKANHNFFITPEDQQYAIQHWKILQEKTTVITYGTFTGMDLLHQRALARRRLIEHFSLPPTTLLFLFNGTMNYAPNTDALYGIVHDLLPRLRLLRVQFRIFICGKGLSSEWEELLKEQPELLVAGFVPDLTIFMAGTDCSINPMTLGAGIKTKMVEALAAHQQVITTESGAQGIIPAYTGDKMRIVPDYQWQAFAIAMSQVNIYQHTPIDPQFFEHYQWDRIIERAIVSLEAL